MDRRSFLGTLAGGVAVGLAGCESQAAGNYDVGMTLRRFRPAVLHVTPGTTVVWKNTSGRAHTVTAYEDRIPDGADFFASGGFESEAAARQGWVGSRGGAIFEGDTYEHTFDVRGQYTYFCVPHEPSGMIGTVVVGDATETN
ncbi:MAG: plastocyanin/azurin family copper-binding protein [Haloarculaceae archaeon]